MAILDNVDNDLYPLFESESTSGVIQDICSNECLCKSENDHKKESVVGQNFNLLK